MHKIAAAKPIFRDRKNRVWELDFLRGFAVLAMCFDHFMCDLAFFDTWFSNSKQVNNAFLTKLSELALKYWQSGYAVNAGFRFWAHYIFVFLFLFLVGTSCAFSRDNTRRGSLLGLVSIAFTGVSFIIKEMGLFEDGIVFGILHCIALSILCAAAVDIATKPIKALNILLPLALGVAIVALGIKAEFWLVPSQYDNVFMHEHFTGYIMGTNAFGDDWFGLFPYVGAVLIGMYWGKAVYAERRSLLPALDGRWNKPVGFVGRHALIFYLAHQVVLAGIVLVVCMCVGYRL